MLRSFLRGVDPRWPLDTVAHVGHDDPLGVGLPTPALAAAVLGLVIAGTTVQLRMTGALSKRWVAVGLVAAAAFLIAAGALGLQHR